ncbi:phage head-tail connector protein [Fulvimarina sp. MAC8]|uniref:head-tail connector protein n=1 Tax=Fulvimarina sp. MAC8 TaxID=3162874 RepID=UPI0032F05564
MVVIDLGSGIAPVGVSELKRWARIARDDEDETLRLLIAAANAAIEAEVGIVLARRQFRLIVDERPKDGRVQPTKTPVVSVDAVFGYGADGTETVFDPEIETTISRDGLSVELSSDVWAASPNGVDVTVTAGLAAHDVPAPAKHAILVAAASWFETRTEAEEGAARFLPSNALRLVRSLKRVRL